MQNIQNVYVVNGGINYESEFLHKCIIKSQVKLWTFVLIPTIAIQRDDKFADEAAKRNSLNALKELAAFAPHKVGEIVKWTEHKRKNIGTIWNPNFVDLPSVEKKAVVVRVKPDVWKWKDDDATLTYGYEFRPIKKDGGLSSNHCYPNKDIIEWTGEVYVLNKE